MITPGLAIDRELTKDKSKEVEDLMVVPAPS